MRTTPEQIAHARELFKWASVEADDKQIVGFMEYCVTRLLLYGFMAGTLFGIVLCGWVLQ